MCVKFQTTTAYRTDGVKVNRCKSIVDQKLAYVSVWAAANALCSLIRWQHFSVWNDVTAAILKMWRQIENTYFVEELYTTVLINLIPIRFETAEP